MPIKIVDLFAGPGGLGEGFSSCGQGTAFKIIVSAEMESSAHSTLRLRSFFRMVKGDAEGVLDYYKFCNGEAKLPYSERTNAAWLASGEEAKLLQLGKKEDNSTLDQILNERLEPRDQWILIGGPPCQAYSIVGRSRNVGIKTYRAEDDPRHFLYKEYLRIIQERRPAVFVMENVLGILSAKVGSTRIFHEILRDLSDPDFALDNPGNMPGYRIHSMVSDTVFEKGMDPLLIDPRKFVIKAEEFGIPQARHRVILLGVRDDLPRKKINLIKSKKVSVRDVIRDLPPVRSYLTKTQDSNIHWEATVRNHVAELALDAERKNLPDLAARLRKVGSDLRIGLTTGAVRHPRDQSGTGAPHAGDWYLNPNLKFWLNHEARGHMSSDLRRYAFAAAYAEVHKHSPVGHLGFSLEGLAPNHENWESGKFADRFRVQCNDAPATTVTSHIAKDGHYFIHPDPTQCRSLTVREAARLQTFPDDYFFQGNRTQQFHQVGNAVPPRLALLIAEKVREILAT